ncbi:hypothetical protein [Streptomyces sp. NPDC056670]|uniref:hypothetical protein n=1 Tax=Streptomyces sp. NPDC056670 TaxID=3345904 RepID=UPI0036C07507
MPYESLRSYFSGGGAGAAPHLLWDPFTGRFTQFFPANSRSKSVVDAAGGTRTNRAGAVVIQIEALFFPYCRTGGKVYPRLVDTPCKGWADLNAWVRSWGVPDTWPMGKPVDFSSNRSESVWESGAGWYAHAQVPENDHQDPGSWPAFIEEDDMPTPQEIAEAVWAHKEAAGPGTEPTRTGAILGWMDPVHEKQNRALALLSQQNAALSKQVADLAAAVAAISARLPK